MEAIGVERMGRKPAHPSLVQTVLATLHHVTMRQLVRGKKKFAIASNTGGELTPPSTPTPD